MRSSGCASRGRCKRSALHTVGHMENTLFLYIYISNKSMFPGQHISHSGDLGEHPVAAG